MQTSAHLRIIADALKLQLCVCACVRVTFILMHAKNALTIFIQLLIYSIISQPLSV